MRKGREWGGVVGEGGGESGGAGKEDGGGGVGKENGGGGVGVGRWDGGVGMRRERRREGDGDHSQ